MVKPGVVAADLHAMLDNVDRRLLGRFERSWERQEEARRVLPADWLDDTRPVAQQLNDLFVDLLERARARIEAERELLARRRIAVGDVRD